MRKDFIEEDEFDTKERIIDIPEDEEETDEILEDERTDDPVTEDEDEFYANARY